MLRIKSPAEESKRCTRIVRKSHCNSTGHSRSSIPFEGYRYSTCGGTLLAFAVKHDTLGVFLDADLIYDIAFGKWTPVDGIKCRKCVVR